MDIEGFRGLLTPDGRSVLAAAAASDVGENALLATASRLRERYPADLVAAALTQVRLRERGRAKFGADAERMYFTPAGLEQSTRASVARHRAKRFATYLPPAGQVLELGCGIGADLIARTREGVTGVGIELDPLTAEVAAANLTEFGLDGPASIRQGDATEQDPAGYAAVFADPGRRTARGRVFDPRSYEPPLDTVLDLAGRVPAACVKVAPGIPHEALWGDAAAVKGPVEAEWVSVAGEVKEAALWLGELAGDVGRRATLISGGADPATETLTPVPGLGDPPVRGWGRYLYEPDGAVIRAHLVAEVAARLGGGLADPHIAYITADALLPTPFAAAYEIEDVLPFSVKRLRGELRRRDVGVLTVKKRGSAVDVDRLRRDLGFGRKAPRGAREMTLVLTRVGNDPIALLARPARA
ncbi:SAM-dependent methyltransferase [Spirillospora sp. NPDC127200]